MGKSRGGWPGRLLRRRREPDTVVLGAAPQDTGLGSWAAGASHIGRVRAQNEDAYTCDAEHGLFAVADGMGGHVAGELASATVVQALNDFLCPEGGTALAAGGEASQEALFQALLHAHAAVLRESAARPELEGMGSTAVIAVLRGKALHVANVGDSRAYLVRDGQPRLLSRDHSVAARLAEEGELSAEEARTHPLRNQLTECLGGHRAPRPDYARVLLRPGDRVLLCSDGLWDMVGDAAMARIVSAQPDPVHAVRELTRAANDAGGQDNITGVAAFPDVAEDVAEPEAASAPREASAEVASSPSGSGGPAPGSASSAGVCLPSRLGTPVVPLRSST